MLQDGDGVQGVRPKVVVVGPDTIRIARGRAPGRNVASVSAPAALMMATMEVEPDLPSTGIERVVHESRNVLLVMFSWTRSLKCVSGFVETHQSIFR